MPRRIENSLYVFFALKRRIMSDNIHITITGQLTSCIQKKIGKTTSLGI